MLAVIPSMQGSCSPQAGCQGEAWLRLGPGLGLLLQTDISASPQPPQGTLQPEQTQQQGTAWPAEPPQPSATASSKPLAPLLPKGQGRGKGQQELSQLPEAAVAADAFSEPLPLLCCLCCALQSLSWGCFSQGPSCGAVPAGLTSAASAFSQRQLPARGLLGARLCPPDSPHPLQHPQRLLGVSAGHSLQLPRIFALILSSQRVTAVYAEAAVFHPWLFLKSKERRIASAEPPHMFYPGQASLAGLQGRRASNPVTAISPARKLPTSKGRQDLGPDQSLLSTRGDELPALRGSFHIAVHCPWQCCI